VVNLRARGNRKEERGKSGNGEARGEMQDSIDRKWEASFNRVEAVGAYKRQEAEGKLQKAY
jgi:hypothetical protein